MSKRYFSRIREFNEENESSHYPRELVEKDKKLYVINEDGTKILLNENIASNLAENDSSAPGYVQNRTHWIDDEGNIHQLDKEFLPDGVIYIDSEDNETITDVETSSSGTSIDVTAQVGQTIVVKEVDANGKPTAWESADCVQTTAQNFTEEQKAQARANIGAKAETEGNVTVKKVSYYYDGDQSAERTFIKTNDGLICFAKVAPLPEEGEVMLVGGSAFVRGESSYFDFTIDITADMLDQTVDIDGAIIPAVIPNQITQIFYQGNRDSAPITYIIVCERPGRYKIAFERWYTEFSFAEAGIYVIDGRAYGKSVYIEDLNISIMIESEGDDVNNPTEYLGNEIQMFHRGLCIGDSITEGVFDYSGANTVIRKYSYPSFLSRMTGIDIVNAGISGLTSKTWYDASVDGDLQGGRWVNGEWVWSTNPDVTEGDDVSKSLNCSGFDFAVIHLGINDTGTIGDTVTLKQAISTFETSINGIIANLKSSSKGIKIFLATIIPYHSVNYVFEQFNEKIKEIASQTSDVYLLDLTTYSDCYGDIYGYGYHLTALGYHKMASEISAYVSYIISHNLEDFKWVQFTGTSYTP